MKIKRFSGQRFVLFSDKDKIHVTTFQFAVTIFDIYLVKKEQCKDLKRSLLGEQLDRTENVLLRML